MENTSGMAVFSMAVISVLLLVLFLVTDCDKKNAYRVMAHIPEETLDKAIHDSKKQEREEKAVGKKEKEVTRKMIGAR